MKPKEELEKVMEEVIILEEELDLPPRKHNCSDNDEDIKKIVEEGLHLERILEDDGDEEE